MPAKNAVRSVIEVDGGSTRKTLVAALDSEPSDVASSRRTLILNC